MNKKLLATMLGALMLASLSTACTKSDDSAVAKIKDAGELVIYTESLFPPFEYLSNNEIVGVDIDICQAVADELGVELKVESVMFDTIVPSIQSNKGDIGASGITITDERAKQVDFSDGYFTSLQYIIVPADVEITYFEDLAGMAIGAQTGSTSDLILSEGVNGSDDEDGNHVAGVIEGTGAECVQYKTVIEAGEEILNDHLDAVISDKLPAENIVAHNPELKCVELVYADGTTTEEVYGLAMKTGSDLVPVVNKVLAEMQEAGTIDESVMYHSAQ